MSNLSIPGKAPRVPSSSAQKKKSPSGPFHSTFSNSKSSSFLSLSKRSPTDVEYQSDAGNYHDTLVVDDKENPAMFTRKQEFKNPSGKTPLLLVPKPEPVSPVKKSTKTGKTPVLLVPKTEPVGEVKKSTKRRPSQFTKLPVEINRWLDELEQSEEDKMNKWCTSSDDDKFFEDANDRWDKVKRSPRKKTRDTASRHTSRERATAVSKPLDHSLRLIEAAEESIKARMKAKGKGKATSSRINEQEKNCPYYNDDDSWLNSARQKPSSDWFDDYYDEDKSLKKSSSDWFDDYYEEDESL